MYTFAKSLLFCFALIFPTENATTRNSPHPETQISRYKFKLIQTLNLHLYREIPRNPSFLDLVNFQGVAISVEAMIRTACYSSCATFSSRNSNFPILSGRLLLQKNAINFANLAY